MWIFNIVLSAVVRLVLLDVCGPQESKHGFGCTAGEHNICFYADDGRIGGLNPIWVQTALTDMVRMFDRLGLQTNLSKTKSMVYTPRFIWGQQGVEAYKQRDAVEGPTFLERKRTRVICEDCRGNMTASSLWHHMHMSHGIVMPLIIGVNIGGGGPETYKVLFLQILKLVDCPVEGCPARVKTPRRMRDSFMY